MLKIEGCSVTVPPEFVIEATPEPVTLKELGVSVAPTSKLKLTLAPPIARVLPPGIDKDEGSRVSVPLVEFVTVAVPEVTVKGPPKENELDP